MKNARTTHPMVIVAATSLTIASLAAIASFSGLLPAHSAPPASPPASAAPLVAEAAPAPAHPSVAPAQPRRVQPAPESRPVVRQAARPDSNLRYASERTTTAYPPVNDAGIDVIPARSAPARTPDICRDCGTVEAVNDVSTAAEGSGLGAIAGGVVGGLLGNQMGQGKGNQAATVLGALGGAYAGHQVEKHVRSEKQRQVTVRFDDGSTRSFTLDGATRWQYGDRVRLSNGNLLPI